MLKKNVIILLLFSLPLFSETTQTPCAFHAGEPEVYETEACIGNYSLSVPIPNTDLALIYHSAPIQVVSGNAEVSPSPLTANPFNPAQFRSIFYQQFGKGWKLSIDSSLVFLSQTNISLITADGTSLRFRAQAPSAGADFWPEDLRRDRSHLKQVNGVWERRGADGSLSRYGHCDSFVCHVTEITDPNGNTITIGRRNSSSQTGLITSVNGPNFNGVTISSRPAECLYPPCQYNNNTESLADKLGRETLIFLTNSNLMTKIRFPISGAAAHRTTFRYQNDGRLISHTNLLAETTQISYYDNGPLKSVTDPLKHKTSFKYTGNSVSIKSLGGVVTENFQLGRFLGFSSSSGESLVLVRNFAGRVTQSTLNGTLVTRFEDFTPHGFPQKITFPDGIIKEFTYNGPWYLPSLLNTKGAGVTLSTSYGFDGTGRLISVTVNGIRNEISYVGGSRLPQTIRRNGTTILSYTYDTSQRLTAVRNVYGVDSLGGSTFSYDSLGRIESVSNLDGSSERYQYGELGNIEKTITNFGSVTGVEYNGLTIQ